MDKKYISIFIEDGLPAIYGIGTYLNLLKKILIKSDFILIIIKLWSSNVQIESEVKDEILYIKIPKILKGKINYYRNVSYILLNYIEKFNNIIFHFNYMSDSKLMHYLKKLFPNSKILLTIHYNINELYKTKSRDYINLEREIYQNCNKIIVLTRYRKNYLLSNNLTESSKILLLPHIPFFFKDSLLLKKPQLLYNLPKKFILFVGRLDENKGIDLLCEAFKEINNNFNDLYLIIAGDGPLLNKLISSGCSIKYNIIFCGFLDQKDLSVLYRKAILGIIPSYYEEFGFVALEMRYYNLPILANVNNGICEVLKNYKLVKFIDLNGHEKRYYKISLLKEVLIEMLKNLDKYNKTINNTNIFREKSILLKDYQNKMLNIYKSMLLK